MRQGIWVSESNLNNQVADRFIEQAKEGAVVAYEKVALSGR